ncbi:pectinesterase [Paenibacillus sp. PastF-3]|uniref:pectinesterase family protein n=1 Tax=Paenibacillus sp. PastF-3 TaxID=2940626 RepID=UPI00247409BE|nr:pectinesterase family protein [Paenibacillus sp. PastF-3]MDH6373627.1 pectinesterase [Paenibacillus sp. PastF-3]
MLVGKEDFCDYHTLQEAVDALEEQFPMQPETLYILSGLYEEEVRIYRSDLTLIGIGAVEIRMNRYAKERDEYGEEIGTFATPTLFLGGRRLTLENLVISNTAGQGDTVGQAIAVYAHCDEAVFRYCTFEGYQDTLFTGPLPSASKKGGGFGGVPLREHHAHYRQMYQHCRIEGTVDYIFGGATAWFDHCELHSLQRSNGEPGYITAASTPKKSEYGYIFNECVLTASDNVRDVYLGRPWREHAATEYVNCLMGSHIHPEGWNDWGNAANRRTARYREHGIRNANSLKRQRVEWVQYYEAEDEMPSANVVFKGNNFWNSEGAQQ